jgi:hypothetical protein
MKSLPMHDHSIALPLASFIRAKVRWLLQHFSERDRDQGEEVWYARSLFLCLVAVRKTRFF